MAIKRLYDTLVGATVAWNQLVDKTKISASASASGITYTNNGDGAVTVSGTATGTVGFDFVMFNVPAGHKLLLIVNTSAQGSWGSFVPLYDYNNSDYQTGLRGKNAFLEVVTNQYIRLRTQVWSGQTVDFTIRPQAIDLTQMFGSTIADYLYNLETATAGAGIAKLCSWGFLRGYQAYNAGSIESVEVTGKKVVGFNQWDEEVEKGSIDTSTGENLTSNNYIRSKNYIRVIGNATYNLHMPWAQMFYYDADKNFLRSLSNGITEDGAIHDKTLTIASDVFYIRFRCTGSYGTTYNHDICINISSDRNGEYEAYTEQTYDYGIDTLRGIFKLDANNNLYADGDVKTADGVITRKYGIRAYQSGDESLADAITDGTTTVYKLTTPTTEQGDPFPSPQVCYPDGTEEYVTSNGVPVGHETRYQL